MPAEAGSTDLGDLTTAWRTLIRKHSATTQIADTGQALLDSWGEPHRRYHDIAHLREVLGRVDELAEYAVDADAVRLAAWYHDVIYRCGPNDEENSALRAETDLDALGVAPVLIQEVARLVRLTTSHDPAVGDRNGEALSDADLAILAAPPDRYAAYTAAVRAEYAHVPDEDFRAGRTNVLRALLAGTSIYRTPHAHTHWEMSARANLSRELNDLS